MLIPRTSSSSVSLSVVRSLPSNRTEPETNATRILDEPHDRKRRYRLATARLADDAEDLPLLDGERDAVDRVHFSLPGLEEGVQFGYLEQRHSYASFVRGSSASRRPSAMKKALRMSHAIMRLGMTMMYGWAW